MFWGYSEQAASRATVRLQDLGPYAVDSVNGLFDSVLTSANERLQAALLDPAFYGLVALVLPGDAGSAKLAELSSELDANLAARRKSRKQTSNATGTHLPSIAATLTMALAGLVAGQRAPPSQAGRNGPAAALASSGNGGSGTSGGGSGGGSGASGGSSGASGGGKGGGKGGGAGPFVPLPRTVGVLVASASVVPGPDRNLFRVPDSNLHNLGGATFHRAKLESALSDLGYKPGTYIVSTLLVADVNPSLDKLLRLAAPDAAGTQDIILPHERWYADKWVVSKGIFDVKTARIANSMPPTPSSALPSDPPPVPPPPEPPPPPRGLSALATPFSPPLLARLPPSVLRRGGLVLGARATAPARPTGRVFAHHLGPPLDTALVLLLRTPDAVYVLADEDLRLPRPPAPSAQPLARAGAVNAGRRLATTLYPSLASHYCFLAFEAFSALGSPAPRARVVVCPAVALGPPFTARGLDWAPVGAVLPDHALAAGAVAVARSFTSPLSNPDAALPSALRAPATPNTVAAHDQSTARAFPGARSPKGRRPRKT